MASGAPRQSIIAGEGVSRFIVRTESESGEPIPRTYLDVRYNGVSLPLRVMEALAGRGSRTASGSEGKIVLNHMPVGMYELWPGGTLPRVGGTTIIARAPVRLMATGGDNVAVMSLAPIEQPAK